MRNSSEVASETKSKADPIRFLFDALANVLRPAATVGTDSVAATVRFPCGVLPKEEGNCAADARKRSKKRKKKDHEGGPAREAVGLGGDGRRWCANSSCFGLREPWSALARGLHQALPSQLKSNYGRREDEDERLKSACAFVDPVKDPMPLEPFLCLVLGSSDWSLEMLLDSVRDDAVGAMRSSPRCSDDSRILGGVADRKGSNELDAFLSNVGFARVGRTMQGLIGASNRGAQAEMAPRTTNCSPKKNIPNTFLSIQLESMEKLRSTSPTVWIKELVESLLQLRPPATSHPDKKKLFAVQDFFRYAEIEGRRLFEELDRDGDGSITLEDLEIAMNRRRLPKKYARQFLRHGRTHLLSRSIGWKQFLALMEQKEPTILRAYTSLRLNQSGTVDKSEILASLRGAGLPANEDNAIAMISYLNSDAAGSISYRHFRNFMILLPPQRLQDDPRNVWLEAATAVSVSPPLEMASESVKRSALSAGGFACAVLTSLMHHPLYTMKVRTYFSSICSTTLRTTQQ